VGLWIFGVFKISFDRLVAVLKRGCAGPFGMGEAQAARRKTSARAGKRYVSLSQERDIYFNLFAFKL
jgi:hypothetical protein